jgi:hypothetical protein
MLISPMLFIFLGSALLVTLRAGTIVLSTKMGACLPKRPPIYRDFTVLHPEDKKGLLSVLFDEPSGLATAFVDFVVRDRSLFTAIPAPEGEATTHIALASKNDCPSPADRHRQLPIPEDLPEK